MADLGVDAPSIPERKLRGKPLNEEEAKAVRDLRQAGWKQTAIASVLRRSPYFVGDCYRRISEEDEDSGKKWSSFEENIFDPRLSRPPKNISLLEQYRAYERSLRKDQERAAQKLGFSTASAYFKDLEQRLGESELSLFHHPYGSKSSLPVADLFSIMRYMYFNEFFHPLEQKKFRPVAYLTQAYFHPLLNLGLIEEAKTVALPGTTLAWASDPHWHKMVGLNTYPSVYVGFSTGEASFQDAQLHHPLDDYIRFLQQELPHWGLSLTSERIIPSFGGRPLPTPVIVEYLVAPSAGCPLCSAAKS